MPFQAPVTRLILVVMLGLVSPDSQSSDINSDSLRTLWMNESESDTSRFYAIDAFYYRYAYAFPDSVVNLSHYHYALAKERVNSEEVVNALNNRAIAYFILGQSDKSVSSLQEALLIVQSNNDSTGMAKILANLGSLKREEFQYQKSMDYYRQSLEIYSRTDDLESQGDLMINIGLIYQDIGELDLAFSYMDSARVLYSESNALQENGELWNYLASIESERGHNGKALSLCRKANVYLLNANNLFALADGYEFMAEVFIQNSKLDSAAHYIKSSLGIFLDIGNVDRIAQNRINLAELFMEKDDVSALRLIDSVEMALPFLTNKKIIAKAYGLLYTHYKSAGDPETALRMNEQYLSYTDSVSDEEQRISLIRESVQEAYEEELSDQRIENKREREDLKGRQLIWNSIIVLLSIGAISWLLLFIRRKSNTQEGEKKVLLEEIEQLKLSSNPTAALVTDGFELDRKKIEQRIDRGLNETDWNVLNILLDDPVISNKGLAERAFVSIDGVGSSLRRMYDYFEVKESKYKKISLILEAIKTPNP